MRLNEIGLPHGRKSRKAKRVGRGNSSGQGSTAGRGHKGQKSRAGGFHKVGFEGGQMPLQRRLPKKGFTNIFRREIASVNLDQLAKFPAGVVVNAENLREQGLIKGAYDGVKILGRGEINAALTFSVNSVSESAKKKIEAAGGKIEVIGA